MKRSAFTLVEILLAMAVASLLMVTLLSILSKSMDVSKQANTSMLSKSSAQAGLDVMVTDLDSLLINRNLGQILCVTNAVTSVGSGSITNAVIYCLTTSMADSYSTNNSGNPGVPRLVQYVISYTNSYASTNPCFALYRNVIDPTNTWNNVIAPAYNLDTSWSSAAASGTNVTNLLVPNVVKMNCVLYTNYGTGGAGISSIYSSNFPPGIVAELSLTVLDESAMTRFTNASSAGNNSPANLIKQYGRTLVRRVSLPSPP